jgi:hypothetical protein
MASVSLTAVTAIELIHEYGQAAAACSTASCRRLPHGISGRTGHRDGPRCSGSLHAPAIATVRVFTHHVAGRGPVTGRLPVMTSNVQSARGALRKVVQDVGVSTCTATAWPGWATVCCQGDVAMSFDGSS